jgi:hypothetical protein
MARRARRVAIPGVLALLIAGFGSGSTSAPTSTSTPAPLTAPPLDAVEAALVVVGDLPGSTVGEAPTSGTISALTQGGLVPAPCVKAKGITSTARTAVGTDVQQPLAEGAKDVTEAVIVERSSADAVADTGQATAGARACLASTKDSSGQYGDASVSTSSITIGRWTGTRTVALDTFPTGVTMVASYVYCLGLGGGLLVLQVGVAFADASPATKYQQSADAIVAVLAQRLAALP